MVMNMIIVATSVGQYCLSRGRNGWNHSAVESGRYLHGCVAVHMCVK